MKKVLFLPLMAFLLASVAEAQKFEPGVLYEISTLSGLSMDNRGSYYQESLLYASQPVEGKSSQMWEILSIGGDTCLFKSPLTQMGIDYSGEGNKVCPVLQWNAFAGNKNQLWVLTEQSDDSYTLTSVVTGYNMGIKDVKGEKDPVVFQMLPDAQDKGQRWMIRKAKGTFDFELNKTSSKNDWENEHVFAINKLDGHVTFVPYASTDEMMADPAYRRAWEYPSSSLYRLLNGDWKFHWSRCPEERPMDFWRKDFDDSTWETIPVPSTIETLGYGTAIYSNANYPFRCNPPFIQPTIGYTSEVERNPIGSYRKDFTLPEDWDGKEVFIHFDGVASAMYVWVNGRKVGYSQVSTSDAEFDITPYVHRGKNTVAVEVYKWCDGSFIEDQDMFRLMGILRDVYLVATPKLHVRDVVLSSRFGNSLDKASLEVCAELLNSGKRQEVGSVQVTLLDAEGKQVAKSTQDATPIKSSGKAQVKLSLDVDAPCLWSAETPYLYTVQIALLDREGNTIEALYQQHGFRQITLVDNKVYINGKKVVFKGTDRHEMHPKYGRTLPVECMIQDILMFKRHNINLVRTSHYPQSPKTYALYDYYGVYVMDEGDVECHGCTAISDVPSWESAYVDRGVRMVCRDRNHPSVVFWSLGNESGKGCNLLAEYKAIKSMDDRLVHYEGDSEIVDMDSEMYPSQGGIRKLDKKPNGKPYFICEYGMSGGNSSLNAKEYMDYIEFESERMIGACVWDWNDHAINRPSYPADHFYYGGGFGDAPNDDDDCCQGLVTPDRKVTPKLLDLKKNYQYITLAWQGDGKLQLHNRYTDYNLSEFVLHYQVEKEGVIVKEGEMSLPNCKPGEKVMCQLENCPSEYEAGKEYFLTMSVRLSHDMLWADKGHEVASEQVALNEVERMELPTLNNCGDKPLQAYYQGRRYLTIENPTFRCCFDSKNGKMISLRYEGREMLFCQMGPQLNWYRSINPDEQEWIDTQYELLDFSWEKAEDNMSVTVNVSLVAKVGEQDVPHTLKYTLYASGVVDVDASFQTADDFDLPRLGLEMHLNPQLEQLQWFGRGPMENYQDRKNAAYVSLYHSTVEDMREWYVRSQTMGERCDVRYLILKDDSGKGIRFTAGRTFDFSALHYTDPDLWQARYCHEQPNIHRPEVVLCLDCIQRGVSRSEVLPPYEIQKGTTYKYSFRIEKE